jgi:hypothetical protein
MDPELVLTGVVLIVALVTISRRRYDEGPGQQPRAFQFHSPEP